MAVALNVVAPQDDEPGLALAGDDLTPARIVAALDRHIVGQEAAKRAVAVALRNRLRRQRVVGALQAEITPKNILLIGPTGVGKTELARRLAELVQAPFVKVDATKFTEVGYVGRNVDSMVLDLLTAAIRLAREAAEAAAQTAAEAAVAERLLDLLHPYPARPPRYELQQRPEPIPAAESLFGDDAIPADDTPEQLYPQDARLRARLGFELAAGQLEARLIDVHLVDPDPLAGQLPSGNNGESGTFSEVIARLMPRKRRKHRMPLAQARERLMQEELARAVPQEQVIAAAKHLVEENGIIFLDELDKVAEPTRGPREGHVSREGVQRDLLPLIEGTQVATPHGPIRTDHILFIAAGAFHLAKPSDLIPELQGRFPIRVELESLTVGDFERILSEPHNALTRQYAALLATDGVDLRFTEAGLRALAEQAVELNEQLEDIGARRLHTLLERVLEGIAFEAPESGAHEVTIDAEYVQTRLGPIAQDPDWSKYIL